RNREEISARTGCSIEIIQIASRTKKDNCDLTGIDFTTDLNAVVTNPEVDVVLELIGGYSPAKELVETALQAGKHVVTANKALIAEHGNELFALANSAGVSLCYEASVAGGIPIIKSVREGLAANDISSVAGIINGTGNFILTEMRDKGRDFEDVLKEAQALGYAEADPTFDVEGIDAAHKLVLLASAAFGITLQFKKAFTEGISKVSTDDVNYAEELGYTIKHLGIAKKRGDGVELRVHPTLISKSALISKVDGVMNAVVVTGDAVGDTLYYGAGAGSEATASAVIADVVDVARALVA
ncbi:homoserine dehydrogenase, partial [Oleiphilus sp. HI0066]|uniref:homoserine dehydrogenase n=5 Tax=Oleiphilus TaxID=141450 RepID=UPI0007C23C98